MNTRPICGAVVSKAHYGETFSDPICRDAPGHSGCHSAQHRDGTLTGFVYVEKRPPILLPDGAPVACSMLIDHGGAQSWTRCRYAATTHLDKGDNDRFTEWRSQHPRALIDLYPYYTARLCDAHHGLLLQMIGD